MIYFSGWDEKGVKSFNGRTGAVTLLNADVITALGFTPVEGNIYTEDGTLENADRTVTLDNSNLRFRTIDNYGAVDFVTAGNNQFNIGMRDPVTGSGAIATFDQANGIALSYLNAGTGNEADIFVNVNGLIVYDTLHNKGLTGQNDFSANYTDFTYVQKIYVDPRTQTAVTESTCTPLPELGIQQNITAAVCAAVRPVVVGITVDVKELKGLDLVVNSK